MRQMCDEMSKLRKMLDEAGIKWKDVSTVTSDELIEKSIAPGIDEIRADTTTYRTHFEHEGYFFSVIYGYNTYGGCDPLSGHDPRLLECMTEKANGGEPQGWPTAEQVMSIVNGGVDYEP